MLSYLVSSHYVDEQAAFRISDAQINAEVDAKRFEPPPVERQTTAVATAILDAYAGTYQSAPQAPPMSATVRRVGDHLTMALGPAQPIDLEAQSDRTFISPAGNLQLTFVKDDKGEVIGANYAGPAPGVAGGQIPIRLNRTK